MKTEVEIQRKLSIWVWVVGILFIVALFSWLGLAGGVVVLILIGGYLVLR